MKWVYLSNSVDDGKLGKWVLAKATRYRETNDRDGSCVSKVCGGRESRQVLRINLTTSGSTVITAIFTHEIHTAK